MLIVGHKRITYTGSREVQSEVDTRANYIDPALKAAHRQLVNIIREYSSTDVRRFAGGLRGRRCSVDYLFHKENRYLAVVEAKRESEHPFLIQPLRTASKEQV